MNLALCGFMGCGKSSVGKELADICNMDFVDLDNCIEETQNLKIEKIFSRFGEDYFRMIESKQLACLLQKEGLVIALGGGALKNKQNQRMLHEKSTVIFIDASLDIILERIKKDTAVRPLVQNKPDEAVRALYVSRLSMYEEACDFKVPGDGTPAAVAKNIWQIISDRRQL